MLMKTAGADVAPEIAVRAWKRVLSEPLLHFVLIGAVIFLGARWFHHESDRYRIVVGPEQTRQIIARYALQYGEPPSAAQLDALVDRYAHEEILYREGVALGLDKDDEIVRRRIVQKVEFVQQDVNVAQEPTLAALQAFYQNHRDRYTVGEKVSFTHVYFSPDAAGDADAKARAEKELAALRRGTTTRATDRGDRFPDLYDYASLGQTELTRLFGQTELVGGVLKAPVNQWSGPFRSGYGWHLVYVNQHETPHVSGFDEVRERVQTDFIQAEREQRNDATFAKLASKYKVVRAEAAPRS